MTSYMFTLVTMEALYFSGPVVSLMAPGLTGFFGVLANHAPIMAALQPGPLTLTLEDGKKQTVWIGAGFLDIRHNRATVLSRSVRENPPPPTESKQG